jgi:hypothetical protein
MDKYIIECKAPAAIPIDWYHVGVRDTLEEAEEAIRWHKSLDREPTEWRFRKIGL